MRTLKKKFISVMLIFTLLMAVFMPLTTYATTIIPVEETGDMHIWTTADGNLHWDGVSEATGYTVTVYPHPGNSAIFTDHISWEYWAYGLYSELDEREFDNGDYRIEVSADGTSKSQTAVIYYDSPYEKLAVPTGLSWSGDMATWNNVPNATSYNVYLRKTTIGSSSVVGAVTGTSVDLSGYSLENGWYFEVVAKADGYRSSELAESPRYGGGTNTIIPVDETGNMHIWTTTDGNLHWDGVSEATGYTVTVYPHPGNSAIFTDHISWEYWAYGLYSELDEREFDNGDYRIEVSADGTSKSQTAVIYYDSPYEKLAVPTGLSWSGDMATWNNVPNATSYNVYLRKTTIGSSSVVGAVTGTSVDLSGYSLENGWYFEVVAKADGYRSSELAESPRYSGGSTTYTCSFNSNGGSGTMSDVTGLTGTYTLPANEFTAPASKQFKGWSLTADGAIITTVSMTENRTVYAIWEDIPATVIDEASATITAPVGGEHPSFTAISANPTAYSITEVTWYDSSWNELTASDTYVAGGTYHLKILFSANAGYELSGGADFYVNDVLTDTGWGVNERGIDFVATAPAHVHELTLVPATAPTCMAKGNNAYYTCSGCDKVFKDALGTVETTIVAETLDIEPNAHDWGDWSVTTPATEEADGEETRVCNHNPSHIDTQPIPKLSHTHTLTLVPAKEPTCTEAGNNAYYTCSGCTKVFKDALGNVETTVVAETLPIDTDAHDWNDWVETTPATVDTAGEKTRTCKHDASHIETLPIEKLALEITEGGNKTYTLDSGAKVQIKCNGTLANFVKLTANGTEVDSKNYTKESGSTIITLKNAYLDTLEEGTYKLAFIYNDQRKAETNLTIAKANTPADTTDDDTNTTTGDNTTTDTTNTTDNTTNGTTTGGETKTSNSPKTGDNIVMYIAIMLVSALGVVGTIKFIKKRD